MKIALLSEKYTPDIGGLAISAGRLGDLLSAAGQDVRLFAPTSSLPPSIKQTQRSNGVHVTRFGAHKHVDDTLVDWFELLVEEHKREPFDAIHAYFLPMAGFVGAYAGKFLGIPNIVSIRGNDIERAAFDPGKFSHVMYALQNASAVTTNASILAKKAKAFFDREIHVIPNGIDIECFKPLKRNEALAETFNLQHSTFTIGFAGELREKKGSTSLLSAFAQINKKIPACLLIVGEVREGEDKNSFDEFREANPQLPITVTGQVPHKDMPAYYSLMDVFVHPSLRDGMPNAVLEAMACGIPVIATPVGGVPDVIQDGKNGILTDINDPGILAAKMMDLLTDPDKRKTLGVNARESVLERFTPEKELEANLSVYRSLGINV
jgi:glycosyltransferase involved in cell wall biosynthesis